MFLPIRHEFVVDSPQLKRRESPRTMRANSGAHAYRGRPAMEPQPTCRRVDLFTVASSLERYVERRGGKSTWNRPSPKASSSNSSRSGELHHQDGHRRSDLAGATVAEDAQRAATPLPHIGVGVTGSCLTVTRSSPDQWRAESTVCGCRAAVAATRSTLPFSVTVTLLPWGTVTVVARPSGWRIEMVTARTAIPGAPSTPNRLAASAFLRAKRAVKEPAADFSRTAGLRSAARAGCRGGRAV